MRSRLFRIVGGARSSLPSPSKRRIRGGGGIPRPPGGGGGRRFGGGEGGDRPAPHLIATLACLAATTTAGARADDEAVEEDSDAASTSVVVPCLNEADTIKGLLTVLTRVLDPPADEVIVVDGNSTDGTPDIVKRAFGREGVRLVRTERSNRAKQMNAGAEAASGDVLIFLHADTEAPRDLVRLVRGALKDPSVVASGFVAAIPAHLDKTYWASSFLHVLKTFVLPLAYRPVGFARGLRILFGDQIMACRRIDFRAVEGYNPRLKNCEDMDLCLKLFYGVGHSTRFPNRTAMSNRRARAWGGRRRIALINRTVVTSGRRIAQKGGTWRCLPTYLQLALAYLAGASVDALNDMASKGYADTR